MILSRGKTGTALAIGLGLLLCLAAEAAPASLDVLDRPSGESGSLELYSSGGASYLDLAAAQALLGGELRWQIPGERIAWSLGGREMIFEDLIVFFTAGDESFQLVAPCLLDGGRFLVPAQLLVQYLPRFFPARFEFNELDNRLVDRTGRQAPVASAAPQQDRAAEQTATDGGSFRIHTVVIDPGHGGKDPGTVRRRHRMNEKEIVLDISRKVAEEIRRRSPLKVLLTRDNDTFIPLKERGRLANENGAGLFVSIHVNASTRSSLNGSSTYFLDAAKTDEERATAMLENAALQYEEDHDQPRHDDEVNLILQDMAQNEYLRESKDLSRFIQLELAGVRGLQDRGLRQANFAVLRGSYMPAALVETAYISNAGDEKRLNSASFRGEVASSIANGILKYIEQYHRKLASGS